MLKQSKYFNYPLTPYISSTSKRKFFYAWLYKFICKKYNWNNLFSNKISILFLIVILHSNNPFLCVLINNYLFFKAVQLNYPGHLFGSTGIRVKKKKNYKHINKGNNYDCNWWKEDRFNKILLLLNYYYYFRHWCTKMSRTKSLCIQIYNIYTLCIIQWNSLKILFEGPVQKSVLNE